MVLSSPSPLSSTGSSPILRMLLPPLVQFATYQPHVHPCPAVDCIVTMWMMIAGSPTLKDLHSQARTWLLSHGHAEDAQAFLTEDKKKRH